MKKYIEALVVEMKLLLKYRMSIIFNSTMLVIPLLGFVFLFKRIYGDESVLGSYSLSGIFTYYFWSLLVYTIIPYYAWSDMTDAIKEGSLVYFLSRPYNFLIHYYFQILGATIVWIFLNFLVVLPFMIFFYKIFYFPRLTDLIYGIIFFIISFHIGILLGFILQLTSFFIGEPYGYMEVYGWVVAFLGGSIIPIDLLPEFFNHIPFRFLFFIPAKAFTGGLINIHLLMIEGFFYIVIFFLLVFFMWKKGLNKYTTFGG